MTILAPSDTVPPSTVSLRPPWTRRRIFLLLIAVGAIVGSFWGLRRVELSVFALVDGWPETQNLLERMWPPYIPREDFGVVAKAVLDTFFMAFAGTALGLFVALPLGLASARNLMPFALVRGVARAAITFARAIPALVFAMVFVRVYGIGVLPGILAIGLHAVGMIGKLIADAAEEIDPGPREGVLSTGASPGQDLVTGVWSQIVPTVIAVTLYRLEIDFRGATLLGFVGAGGVGVIMRGYQGNLRYQELLGVTLLLIALVIVMEVLSAITRRAILGEAEQDIQIRRWSVRRLIADRLARTAATRDVTRPPLTYERFKLAAVGLAGVVLLMLSFIVPDVSLTELIAKLGKLPEITWRLVPKNLDWLSSAVVDGLIETVAIGFAATFLALVAAVPFAFLAAKNTAPGPWIYRIVRLGALLLRAAPELVVAVIFVAAIGLGPAAGTLALAIGMFGFSMKLFADAIEEAQQGPRDGVRSTGATALQDVTTAVSPQVLPSLLGNMLYVLDVSLRSSTVLGIVGAGGIGFLLSNAARTLNFEVMGGIILSIFVIVYAIELLASWVRKQVI